MRVSRRRVLRSGALVLLAVGALAGCGDRGEPLRTEHAGYAAYREYCRRCHGNEGDGAKASRMADRTVDLGAPAFRDTMDAARVARLLRLGKGRMEGYEEKLTPGEIDTLADYVLGLAGARAEARRTAESAGEPR